MGNSNRSKCLQARVLDIDSVHWENLKSSPVLRWIGPVAFFTIFVSFIWVGYTSLQAQYELNKVRTLALNVKNQGKAPDSGQVADFISESQSHFAKAHQYTSGPAWWLVTKVPYLGRTPTAVQTLTRNLYQVSLNTKDLEVKLRIQQNKNRGVIDTRFIASLLTATTKLKTPIQNGAYEFHHLNYEGIPQFVASPIQQVGNGFINLEPLVAESETFNQIAPALLGLDKPRTWMLVFLNGAEARAIGGFPGGWGLLKVSAGKIKLTEIHDDVRLNVQVLHNYRQYVSSDQAQLYGEDLSRWADMNLSPDFPTNARLMAALLLQSEGQDVDGVLALNQTALSQMMIASGPINHKGHVLTTKNIGNYVTKGIYADYQNGQEKNRATLLIIRNIFERLNSASAGPLNIFQALIPPIHDGHLKLWSADAQIQRKIAKTLAGGSLTESSTPTHAVVFVNGAGNKIDAYVATTVQYTQGICVTDLPYRNSYVRIALKNNAPTSGLPNYVTPRSDLPKGHRGQPGSTKMIVYVHTPLGSTFEEATLNGKTLPLMSAGVDNGRQVWRFDVDINAASTGTLFVTLNEPAIGNELIPTLWTQSMPIPVKKEIVAGPRCVR